MPATFDPMSTDPRTTIGWIPTACAMSRGWTTFMTRNQPTPIAIRAGSVASGFTRMATSTGGTHDTNGPKNGIAMSRPDAADVTPPYGSIRMTLVRTATRP